MEFQADTEGDFRPARPNSPRVVTGLWRGQPAVSKCYAHCSWFYRQTVGRLAISRESWALEQMEGSERAPRPFARPAPWTIIMEKIEGTPLESLSPEGFEVEQLVSEAEILLRRLEIAGVVHADLGHDYWSDLGRECNLIWTPDHRLVAIDFAGSLPLLAGGWPWNRLTRALRAHDQLLTSKVLHHFAPHLKAHPAWRYPSQLDPRLWELWRLLGKL